MCHEVAIGTVLLSASAIFFVSVIIATNIEFKKVKQENSKELPEQTNSKTTIKKDEKEFEYIDGKKKDLTLNEINDIEELREDDDLL